VISETAQDFPRLLRRHRLVAGLSQEALAERSGLSVRGISDLERGVRRAPHPATCARLAEALKLDDTARAELILAARGAPSVVPATVAPAILAQRRSSRASSSQRPRLVEREHFLDSLNEFLTDVEAGQGRLVLLGGEAGVAKSVLVQQFGALVQDRARVHIGACDPLSTPTALGPLLDVAEALGEPLASLLANAEPAKRVFDALLAVLHATERPTLLVFEDLHWADEATLDLMRFVGRRMVNVPALVVATYRDEE
jgi:transcriptional regulator with XRE-family HTH domain